MYRVRLCLAAEGVVVDREGGALSVFSILDRLTVEGFPSLIQKSSFLVVWERDPDDAPRVEGRFSVHLGDRELLTQTTQVDFEDRPKNQTVLTMFGLPILAPGVLIFRMTLPPNVTAEYRVEVVAGVNALRPAVARPGGG
jgi:hypothetical protein